MSVLFCAFDELIVSLIGRFPSQFELLDTNCSLSSTSAHSFALDNPLTSTNPFPKVHVLLNLLKISFAKLVASDILDLHEPVIERVAGE